VSTNESSAAGLVINGLQAGVAGKQILNGIDLRVGPGEIHAVMGPNGAGKSTLAGVLMGRPGYSVSAGSISLDGRDLGSLPTWERAAAGLFLVMQYPIEVPGVSLQDALGAALTAQGRGTDDLVGRVQAEADRIEFGHAFLDRALNVDMSGGEKKRNETLQLAVLRPRYVVLDEIDSGLDVDALRICARRIAELAKESGMGVLAITHYHRLLDDLQPDVVHVLARGRIAASGGPELARDLERDGYAAYGATEPTAVASAAKGVDPFADPFA
jgi:Fe-S cluster assembly ATP-binding protein